VDAAAWNATMLITSAVIVPNYVPIWWQALLPLPHCLKLPPQDRLKEPTALEETVV